MRHLARFAITGSIALTLLAFSAPSAQAQYGGKPGSKQNPYGKKGSTALGSGQFDKKNRRTDDSGDHGVEKLSATPEHQRCDLVLGQRARGSLADPGNSANLEFRAPQGAVVRFSFGFVGKIGDSTVALHDGAGTPLESFKRDGRQFTLTDYVIPKSGSYAIYVRHDGVGKISFVMSSSVKYLETIEARLELSSAAAVPLRVPGFDDRAIQAVYVTPADGGDSIFVSLTLTDSQADKVASLDGERLTPTNNQVPCPDEILIPNLDEYKLDVWLLSGGEKRTVDVKLKISKPALGTGTVDLRDR